METLGEFIRKLRDKKDVSIRELSKKLGISAPFLSDIELGRRYPSEEILDKLAKALHTTSENLKKYDSRPPVQELKRMSTLNPAMGIALRKFVDDGISSEELMTFLKNRQRDK